MTNGMLGKKRGRGRKKIEIKKIEENSSRQVTLSKRRHGLFNKASELCILTGAHVAILIPQNNRVLSFSHPPNDAVLNRFLSGIHDPSRDDNCETLIRDFGEKYSDLCAEVDKARIVEAGATPWWEKAEEEMGLEELEQFTAALQELFMNVDVKANELELCSGRRAQQHRGGVFLIG